ncbi:hypothetical protein [Lentzea sp. NBRC 102530]|uniref:hypothetical protein n=1 Tax=Lentzea sp. NBRC 102530 TaxID=3032201 RepID=UPI0024A00975|nr:hypothetical protein [Lentzea sp. NBRC 102530]GLY50822.1 hypothetical protein Lesp01_44780 [Lentzea sp. NBRC 102530]
MSATAGSLRLTIPENWYDLSVADEAAENAVVRRLRDACADTGIGEQPAARLADFARRSLRAARRSGVLHVAGTFELHEGRPLVAIVVAALITPPANADLLDALTEHRSGSGTWTRVSAVRLDGIGEAARVHGVQDVVLDDTTRRCAVMHTLIRVPGRPQVLVITGTSPDFTEADALFDLFDRITATAVLR